MIEPSSPWGFDVERTVPSDRHLRRKLQYAEGGVLKAILARTVADLRDQVPGRDRFARCQTHLCLGQGE